MDGLSDEMAGLSVDGAGLSPDGPGLSSSDDETTQWLDITQLVRAGTAELGEGELLRADGLSLFDALTSVEVMDPRLDMGVLTAADEAEIGQWDVGRTLTAAQALWVAERAFQCEMTWHASASLLQTMYACNYVTDPAYVRLPVGRADSPSPVRDRVLYPLLVAAGRCCRRVWDEYKMGNLYSEEDVFLGTAAAMHFFDEFSDGAALALLDGAAAWLDGAGGAGNDDDDELRAVARLRALVRVRRRWLEVAGALGAAELADDPAAALDRALQGLQGLRTCHAEYVAAHRPADAAWLEAHAVRGAFDFKCMRRYAATVPVKPRALLGAGEAHAEFGRLARDLALAGDLAAAGSAEQLMYFFLGVAQRDSTPHPYVRSVLMSVLAQGDRVQLREPMARFASRAVRDMAPPADPDADAALCDEAARLLTDWFRTMCQNVPRQRRVALKSLPAWDLLQAEAEALDIAAYRAAHPAAAEDRASDPACNPFWLSSWAYHAKLLLMEAALLAGARLELYQDYELPSVLCYATQVLEAHVAHLARWADLVADSPSAAACVTRWHALLAAQKDLAMALWLAAHACERLRIFAAPWARGPPDDVRRRLDAEPARRARYALRFRAFAQLGSPPYVTFESYGEAAAQLDAYPLAELFIHAQAILARARAGLDAARRARDEASPAAWDRLCHGVNYAIVSNSVALARLLKGTALVHAPELALSGAQAGAHHYALAQQQQQQQQHADQHNRPRPRSKRGRKKHAPPDHASTARKWQSAVDAALRDAAVCVRWSCPLDKGTCWPVFSFIAQPD
ncbi:N-alpha-acetyltransferase, non-catalitic subunit [Coemansia javaensis]|uniref:N-alpha-acetyltransferase, non-catalitic subunit n=1 Tax=Coemansia javaensis TaxID=2761396 RepID=A0A9W8HHF8_9FUNG|nr:N-alpha-acetyltransferase, non-catalitic subunit [Coemansia javaensis]